MIDPREAAEAEAEAATRFTRRLTYWVLGLAVLLVSGGVLVARAVNQPVEGVDLDNPPEYGPNETVRIRREGNGFSFLGTPVETINLTTLERDQDGPAERQGEIITIYWTDEKPELRHLLQANGRSVLEVDGEELVVIDSGYSDESRVYVGPRNGRLVPVSRAALSRDKAVSLPRSAEDAAS